MSRPAPVRGVIEGFYGTPWTRAARREVIETLGSLGMNAYVYAPKDDPKHRVAWREPYDQEELGHFEDLAAVGRAVGVRVGFAISPGLDMAYADPVDRAALLDKLAALVLGGIDWVVLALDDIPNRAGLAAEQAELATVILGALHELADVRLTLVPTEYVGMRPTPYLADLAAKLPAAVDLMWTGPTVCSPEITATHAEEWAAAVGGRKPIVWDNYPVNDATMAHRMHLGPYRGRDPALTDAAEGILLNPMTQARASLVAVATAAEYLLNPSSYDPAAAWSRAIERFGGSHARGLEALAEACADGPIADASTLRAHRLLDAIDAGDGADRASARASLREHLEAVRASGEGWPADDALHDELVPWIVQARAEADAGLAALRLLRRIAPEGPPADADPEQVLLEVFGVLFAWAGVREHGRAVVFGPRFSVYPAIVQLPDGRPALDVPMTVHEDRSAIDRLCRLALHAYDQWRLAQAGMPA